jgi:hypothetical protein
MVAREPALQFFIGHHRQAEAAEILVAYPDARMADNRTISQLEAEGYGGGIRQRGNPPGRLPRGQSRVLA